MVNQLKQPRSGSSRQSRTWVALALITAASFASAAQQEPITRGMEAFRAGDYRTAVEHFTQAADSQAQPTLIYNTAVSYYRLGEYEKAQPLFSQLSELPKWRALAFYNLALVAEARGNQSQAAQWTRLCLQHSGHDKLTALAEKKLKQLTAPAQTAPTAQPGERANRWAGLASLSWGRDSNAANLAEDVLRAQSQGSDTYLQLITYGQTYYAGKPTAGSKAFVLASVKRFDRFTSLSSLTVGGGLVWERPLGPLASASGAQLLYLSMDGDPIATQLQLHWGAKRNINRHVFAATYYPSYFFASGGFSHIAGWRHRLDVDWQHKGDDVDLKVRYRHEINDRKDKQVGERFASYSPTSDALSGQVSWSVSPKLTLTGKLQYQRAEFFGTNNLRTLTGLDQQESRRYQHWQYELGAAYKVAEGWLLSAELGNYSRDDNFAIYTYDGSTIKAALEYRF